MEQIKLDALVREEIGSRKIGRVRREDFIPAVVYGENKKNTLIKVDRKTFERIERAHRGESVVLYLNVLEGDKKLKDYAAIIKEIQHDPVTDRILHVDFNRISLTKEIEVKIPIVARGEAIGVKQEGGVLDHVLWELEVICLPTKIPAHIEVDVSQLKINDSIHIKDVVLPEGVKTKQNPDSILFAVKPPMKQIEPEAAAAVEEGAAKAEPEVIKEKKDKVEGKEGAAKAVPAGRQDAKDTKETKDKKPAEGQAAPKGK